MSREAASGGAEWAGLLEGSAFTDSETSGSLASVEADDMKSMNDVERNGYCFSDGVGVISHNFAERVSKEKLKLN